ncbi:MAG: class I SAM-dependent methyltransferase [Parcubacteria group bacterium]|jgi:2-polyprenyl-3-methyl-5-hydroxy-6-metoxy-1,4-benzoquinol methylase
MRKLPNPVTYSLEMKFMPWGKLLAGVLLEVIKRVPRNGSVIDLMCGPGFLLDMIRNHRPDLALTGVDIDYQYIRYASKKNPGIQYKQANVLSNNYHGIFDCVICTGSMHHLPYETQPLLFDKMSSLISKNGLCICADPCISEYTNELDRQLAAAELGYEYLKAVLHTQAPLSIIDATLNISHNDVLADGEYKNSLSQMTKMASQFFGHIEINKIWPNSYSSYGDYYIVCHD